MARSLLARFKNSYNDILGHTRDMKNPVIDPDKHIGQGINYRRRHSHSDFCACTDVIGQTVLAGLSATECVNLPSYRSVKC